MTEAAATIVVASGPRTGERFELDEELIVGREDADITLADDAEISRRHAALRPIPGGVEVVDLDSRNGTVVDGRRVDGSSPARNGSVIEVGTTRFTVEMALPDVATTRQAAIVQPGDAATVQREAELQPTVAQQQPLPPPPTAPEPGAADTAEEPPPPAEPSGPPAPVRVVMGFIFGAGPEKIKLRGLTVVLTWTLLVAAITVLVYSLVS